MLQEEKSKTRDEEEDRKLYVMARKDHQECGIPYLENNLDFLIQDTAFWSLLSTRLEHFEWEEEKAEPIKTVIQKLYNAEEYFEVYNLRFRGLQLPEVKENVMVT